MQPKKNLGFKNVASAGESAREKRASDRGFFSKLHVSTYMHLLYRYCMNYYPAFNINPAQASGALQVSNLVFTNQETSINQEPEQSQNWLRNVHYTPSYSELAVIIPFNKDINKPTSRYFVNRVLKRMLDMTVSVFVLVFILSWLIPLIGILIKAESRGPVFFKQIRSGINNKKFWCYKFRSMVVNTEADEKQAVAGDARITKMGAFLRKTSLDELPQFLNILTGDMTLVGPRPHMLKHTEYYGSLINNYNERLAVKQGLTGWAQIKGYRGETNEPRLMEERVIHDIWYVNNWSFWLDIKIICLTVINVFKKEDNAR